MGYEKKMNGSSGASTPAPSNKLVIADGLPQYLQQPMVRLVVEASNPVVLGDAITDVVVRRVVDLFTKSRSSGDFVVYMDAAGVHAANTAVYTENHKHTPLLRCAQDPLGRLSFTAYSSIGKANALAIVDKVLKAFIEHDEGRLAVLRRTQAELSNYPVT